MGYSFDETNEKLTKLLIDNELNNDECFCFEVDRMFRHLEWNVQVENKNFVDR